MERKKSNHITLNTEAELSIISPERTTEESGLKSNLNKNNDNNDSINNTNNSSYMQLTNETNLNLNENNANNTRNNNNNININNININNNQFNYPPTNESRITRSTQLRAFIPFVSIKILIPVFFMLKYLIYSFENEEDQKYCKISVWVVTFLIFLCYFLAVFTPTNQTNVNEYFDQTKNNILTVRIDNPGNKLQDLVSSQWADCAFCQSKKFIRSSHCRICNKCVLFRDHHCPYIANCVGFKNMQYFINFLFWGDFGLLFYVISFIKFHFFSEVRKIIVIPLYLKAILYGDFIFTCFFVINLFGLMSKLFINIYNNRTQLENMRTYIVEYYCPICPKCVKDFTRFNIQPEVNFYNIGFLSHLYYIIGPTPFHFIFPLPKYNNYILDENCPIFKKIKNIDRMSLFKYIVNKDPSKINILDGDESSPNVYIQSCHKYYDGKKIV